MVQQTSIYKEHLQLHLFSLSNGSSNGRRKVELRLHTANIDAALSVVRLAAAIGSITGTNDSTCGKDSVAMAVCAEAAESVGAPRDLCGKLWFRCPDASRCNRSVSAATCLPGAATLRSRTTVGCHSQEAEVLLNSGTLLPGVMPTGERKERVVSINLSKMRLLLIITKYLGAVPVSKQYTIVDATEEAREARAYH